MLLDFFFFGVNLNVLNPRLLVYILQPLFLHFPGQGWMGMMAVRNHTDELTRDRPRGGAHTEECRPSVTAGTQTGGGRQCDWASGPGEALPSRGRLVSAQTC